MQKEREVQPEMRNICKELLPGEKVTLREGIEIHNQGSSRARITIRIPKNLETTNVNKSNT